MIRTIKRWLTGKLPPLRIVIVHKQHSGPNEATPGPHIRIVCPENDEIMFASESYSTLGNAQRAAFALSDRTGWEITHSIPDAI